MGHNDQLRVIRRFMTATMAAIALGGCGATVSGVDGGDGGPRVDAVAQADAIVAVDTGAQVDTNAQADTVGSASEYRAEALATALNRVVITRAWAARDLCAVIVLENPVERGEIAITLPPRWSVGAAFVTQGAARCTAERFPSGESARAARGSGSVTWEGPSEQPACRIDVHAVLYFENAPAWVPAEVPLDVDGLNVAQDCL